MPPLMQLLIHRDWLKSDLAYLMAVPVRDSVSFSSYNYGFSGYNTVNYGFSGYNTVKYNRYRMNYNVNGDIVEKYVVYAPNIELAEMVANGKRQEAVEKAIEDGLMSKDYLDKMELE